MPLNLISLSMFVFALPLLWSQDTILMEWMISPVISAPVKFTLIMDPTGLMYAAIVSFISANVLTFSKTYMKDDPFINRFTILVVLFIISMNMLIFIPHFMALLLGWDGLGITSFILVIYYQNPKSLGAGMITALTNRVGDVMLLVSIAITLNQGHWNIIHMWNDPPLMYVPIMLILIAACTKSAQMPFSSWLPAAMAAPTPVSALVHSSTLVTGGVFLLIRFYSFLSSMPMFNYCLMLMATATMTMAGISAITECDMKKIIALSTLSQLGVMMMALSLNLKDLATFHMMTHALFKALLFICAGELITYHTHSQELRWMGNLIHQAPIASTCMLIANYALCGIPFMAGFYSKDLILESVMTMNMNPTMTLLILPSVMITVIYSIRFSMFVTWSPRNHLPMSTLNETSSCVLPMITMSMVSIMGGAAILWLMPELFLIPPMIPSLKLLPLLMILISILISLLFIIRAGSAFLSKHNMLNYASCLMWFLTPLSTQLQLKLPMSVSHGLLKSVDHGWLETMSSQGINKSLSSIGATMTVSSPKAPIQILLASASLMAIITISTM